VTDKLTPLHDAIHDHLRPGDSIVIGAGLEPEVPFAATHEIIRQCITGLNVIAPISDVSTDMLIGAGCCSEITGAWVGNVSSGLGHNYRRSVEKSDPYRVKINDHSNFSLGMALMAGAYGMPYAPMRSILGSDILKSNPTFKITDNPFGGTDDKIVQVPPLIPDVAIIAVQRADRFGNNHHWGSRGLIFEAAMAAEKLILLADEIVEPEVISSDPGRVLVPGFRTTAVCHIPGGVHPSPMTGRWQRDTDFFGEYHQHSRTREGFLEWLDDWVLKVPDHKAYAEKLGTRLQNLRITGSALAADTNYAAE